MSKSEINQINSCDVKIEDLTPVMQQYMQTKRQNPEAVLLYRLGDFYETFFEDAVLMSKELELTLTGKECGQEERAPMCGIPYHAVDTYLARLIAKGYKVAICEQLEDPKFAKGMVKRDVIRVVTPGTVTEANLLDDKKNNYIMSIYKNGIYFGVTVCDVTTGDFRTTEIKGTSNFSELLDEISKYSPAEIIVNPMLFDCTEEIDKIKERFEAYLSRLDEEKFSDNCENLLSKYKIIDDDGNMIENLSQFALSVASTNALLFYLLDTQKNNLDQINRLIVYSTRKYMSLDINARRNLEITEKLRDKAKKGTLLWVLDKTATAMGGRLLRRWLNTPLVNPKQINARLDAVAELKDNIILRGDISDSLKKVYDIERLASKIAYGSANGRDLISLKNSAKQLPEIKKILSEAKSNMIMDLYTELDTLDDIYELIEKTIVEEPPISVKEGGLIKLGYDEEVDKLKTATTEGKNWIIQLEAEEKEKTGIKGLKIGFNKVFGYYIEVTKANMSLVPDRYIRKQTLTNGERYITEELKNLENQILGAEEKVVNLEYNIFTEVRDKIEKQVERLQKSADIIASLDCLCSFATVADDMNYVRPQVDRSGVIDIKDGRHPVIEKILPSGSFVQNDTYLDKDQNRLSIITGPNMAGKSTYMRQVALITLMAQCGSFVPASYAKIGVVDKIFTRVGASDDLSMGQSTFMVEMMEVAQILKEATNDSLVILDEIGRGTSTYDGLSIAWAVAEYISDSEKCGAKTLFATHYHELTDLENKLDGVKNYSVAVKEKGEDVIFLRKIVRGGTDESYGVHVAKLAGVPQIVTKRANEILKSIERKNVLNNKKLEKENKNVAEGQLTMYNYKLAEIAHELDKVNVNELTPIEALNTLVKIKEKMSS